MSDPPSRFHRMARTRLAWHLFAGWCGLVTVLLLACYWLASVQLAALATAGQRQRLADAARSLAALADDGGGIDADVFAARAAELARGGTLEATLVAADGRLLAAGPTAATRPDDARGPFTGGGRYDASTGRRHVAVSEPVGPPGRPVAMIRVTADTTAADAALTRGLGRLLGGFIAAAALTLAGGWLVARRAARPVEDLRDAAVRLAAGDVEATLPAPDLAEAEGLAKALAALREQLVERGLTIGRQGTQQEAVLGSMIEGVLAIDARQRIVGINRAAADLLGIGLDDVIRRPLQEVIRNPDLRRFALLAIDCREPVEDDLVLRGARDRTLRLRGTALRDVSGEGGAVIVLNDVTDMQRLENVRRDFVANVSHELRTPVASIKGFVETLLDGAVDEPADARRFLEIVGRQADRLAAIIEDLLALSRIEQREGSGSLPLEQSRVADILAAAVAECGPRAAAREIALETVCPESLVAVVNPPLVEQAVINLVDNAIKYSDPGRSVRIEAGAEAGGPTGGSILIRVHDEGAGIAAEHLPRLFERFYRVDKARSRTLGGTGLGLSIVKHIVQAHGGGVTVESTPGVGSSFTIRLPLTADDPD